MTQAMITLRSNEAEMIVLRGTAQSTDTGSGWLFELKLDAESREIALVVTTGAAADVSFGREHYPGAILECDPAGGRIVVRGDGPAPRE